MKLLSVQPLRCCFLLFVVLGAWDLPAQADPVPVHQTEGSVHGFLEVRSEDGRVVASGEVTHVLTGDRITSRTIFKFKDGSVDDETTIFTQRRTLQLISDHHIQKGPFFPHPIDILVEARTGQVIVHSWDKDGKEDTHTEHMNLPVDVANGIVPVVLENLRGDAGATVSMVIATPKPRLVKLVVSNAGDVDYLLAGSSRKAIHYGIKIELGGVAGVVAPLIGKAPPDLQIWTIGGQATTFAREMGPLYPEGPMMTIQLASPTWTDTPKPGQ